MKSSGRDNVAIDKMNPKLKKAILAKVSKMKHIKLAAKRGVELKLKLIA